jgi:hypothetical protein
VLGNPFAACGFPLWSGWSLASNALVSERLADTKHYGKCQLTRLWSVPLRYVGGALRLHIDCMASRCALGCALCFAYETLELRSTSHKRRTMVHRWWSTLQNILWCSIVACDTCYSRPRWRGFCHCSLPARSTNPDNVVEANVWFSRYNRDRFST